MKENPFARNVQIIGIIEVIAALILSIFLDLDEILGAGARWYLMICSLITLVIFEGFAEIIELLHKNNKKQDEIIDLLKNVTNNKKNTPKTELEDIELNLPEM